MPCNCNSDRKYVVRYKSGLMYKTYGTKVEADAAAKRIGGNVTAK